MKSANKIRKGIIYLALYKAVLFRWHFSCFPLVRPLALHQPPRLHSEAFVFLPFLSKQITRSSRILAGTRRKVPFVSSPAEIVSPNQLCSIPKIVSARAQRLSRQTSNCFPSRVRPRCDRHQLKADVALSGLACEIIVIPTEKEREKTEQTFWSDSVRLCSCRRRHSE